MKPQLIQKTSPEYWFSVIIYALEKLGKATYIDIYSFLIEDYNLEDDFSQSWQENQLINFLKSFNG